MSHSVNVQGPWTEVSGENPVRFPTEITDAVYLPGDGRAASISSGSTKFKRGGDRSRSPVKFVRCDQVFSKVRYTVKAVDGYPFCTVAALGSVLQISVGGLHLRAQDGQVAITVDREIDIEIHTSVVGSVDLLVRSHFELPSNLHERLSEFCSVERDTYILLRHGMSRVLTNRNFLVQRMGTGAEVSATCPVTFRKGRKVVAKLPFLVPGYATMDVSVLGGDKECASVFFNNAKVSFGKLTPRIVMTVGGVVGDAGCVLGLEGRGRTTFHVLGNVVEKFERPSRCVPDHLKLVWAKAEKAAVVNDWLDAVGAAYLDERASTDAPELAQAPGYDEYVEVLREIRVASRKADLAKLLLRVPPRGQVPLEYFDSGYGGAAITHSMIREVRKGPSGLETVVDSHGQDGGRPDISRVEDLGDRGEARLYGVLVYDVFGKSKGSSGAVVLTKPPGIQYMQVVFPAQMSAELVKFSPSATTQRAGMIHNYGDDMVVQYKSTAARAAFYFWVYCHRRPEGQHAMEVQPVTGVAAEVVGESGDVCGHEQ